MVRSDHTGRPPRWNVWIQLLHYQFIDLYLKHNDTIIKVPGFKVYTNQTKLFDDFGQLWPVLLSFAIGAIIMLIFIKYEKVKNNGVESQPV